MCFSDLLALTLGTEDVFTGEKLLPIRGVAISTFPRISGMVIDVLFDFFVAHSVVYNLMRAAGAESSFGWRQFAETNIAVDCVTLFTDLATVLLLHSVGSVATGAFDPLFRWGRRYLPLYCLTQLLVY